MHRFNIKQLLVILFLLLYCRVMAQVPYQPPAYPANVVKNYVRVWDAASPQTDPNVMMTKQVKEVKQSTQYFDGLGRPLQTVIKEGSLETTTGIKADIVSPAVYDEFGREQYQFLPFVSAAAADGNFKLDPFQQQKNFYDVQLAGQNEMFYYGQTKFEASPLNRPEESFASGNNWVGTQNQTDPNLRRSLKMKYWINTLNDAVRIWNVTDNPGNFGTYATPGVYPAGELYKTITIDEHGKQVIEFKDKEGKVVLKRVQLTGTADDGTGNTPSVDGAGWLCTYYIYDDLNNLRCVIQPRGVELLKNTVNWDLNAGGGALLSEQCFRYEYDQRNRMLIKKVPGAAEVYMIYDIRDRLVMTQDGNLRTKKQWMVTGYDQLNRPVTTHLITDNANYNNFLFHYTNAYNSSSYPVISQYPNELLSQTAYDDYGSFAGYANFDNADEITNNLYPVSNTNYPYAQPLVKSTATKGMVVWTQTKVLGTASTYITNLFIYDEKGRVIQTKTLNHTGGIDYVTTQYSWNNLPLVTVQKQQLGGTAQRHVVITKPEYDDLWRVVTMKKAVNSLASQQGVIKPEQVIVRHEYDKLGQLKQKQIGIKPGTTTTPLETLSYDYNIRGWLLGMNKAFLKDNNESGYQERYFGFELGYDKDGYATNGSKQYNGNIGLSTWKSTGDDKQRKFDYSYDAANRLLKANYLQKNGTWNTQEGMNYTVQMGDGVNASTAYDANGNILAMKQWGWKGLGSNATDMVDNLSYTYLNYQGIPFSNKLTKVAEAVAPPAAGSPNLGDFKDGANGTLDDYSYDINGNLTADNNKNISSIVYNHLNLPQTITVTGKGTISYTYDAGGNKLKKTTQENNATVRLSNTNHTTNITTVTDYIMGFVYETKTYSNSTLSSLDYYYKLQLIPQEEGRIRPKFDPDNIDPHAPIDFFYDYFVKDHLGNVRMVLTEENQTDVYPAATLEGNINATGTPNAINIENSFYSINTSYVVNKTEATGITNYQNNNVVLNNNPYSNTTANSEKLYKLHSNTNKTGLGILLKVMAGDVIHIFGKSYYFENNTGGSSANQLIPVADIAAGLTGAPSGLLAGKVTQSQLTGNSSFNSSVLSFLTNPQRNDNSNPQRPKAAVNWLLMNEQMKFVTGNFSPVGAPNVVKDHYTDASMQNITIDKSGYIYIYVSNESPVRVFFDNLQVGHTRGAVLEETHYYPFGLTMAGISSKAAGGMENKKKYNGIEFENDLDLNTYDAFFRELDPQIGRWWQPDPEIESMEMWSPYASNYDNPITYSDPLGDEPEDGGGDDPPSKGSVGGGIVKGAKNFIVGLAKQFEPVPIPEPGTVNVEHSFGIVTKEEANQEMTTVSNMDAEDKAAYWTQYGLGVGATLALPQLGNKGKSGTTSPQVTKPKAPNPNGKNGGPAHQSKVAAAESKLKQKGYETKREVKVGTPPGSNKANRFVDVVGTKKGRTIYVNVGKKNKNGTPVSRERKALSDIKKSPDRKPDSKVVFIPYN